MIIGEVTLVCRGLRQGLVHPTDKCRDPSIGRWRGEHKLVGASYSGGPRPGVGHCESWVASLLDLGAPVWSSSPGVPSGACLGAVRLPPGSAGSQSRTQHGRGRRARLSSQLGGRGRQAHPRMPLACRARRVAVGVLSWGHSQPSLLSKLEPPLASTARAGHWVPPGGG